ncbi:MULTISPECIES: ankyrin repeat domain-containing protein [unclassified Mesorhizobium]|uniref:ankyrin repeat domain-containing protein n=1 Tax=unclassified Mesorhizobium TaxID=325217 RepID=UPI0024163F89|nr:MULTISPECIES: ankyrin repeat domain-containing protein [unclassified Mesorhizobium]MDG4904561.1 ankyrin repeat domain-containing protein [Mesorhizobium sp. WSM4962]MDG4920297.1 ankyrin repeat domain-containing protein [Mesorhizobium sp. WSM4989]
MRDVLLFILLLLLPVPTASYAAAIHDAAMKGDIGAITAALDAGAGVDESDGKATPLYLAVKGGHFAAAKMLIERGADVNAAPTPCFGSCAHASFGKTQDRPDQSVAGRRRESKSAAAKTLSTSRSISVASIA